MRLYKIIDKSTFDKAKEIYVRIEVGSKENKRVFEEEFPFEFDQYLDTRNPFEVCKTYAGAIPKHPFDEVPKGWRAYKGNKKVLIPCLRTKEGKRIASVLNKSSVYVFEIPDVLDVDHDLSGRVYMPDIYISKDQNELYVRFDTQINLDTDTRFEEVTISYVKKMMNN